MIFFENACSHWQSAICEPRNPRPAPAPIEETPSALQGHPHAQRE
jgi:hypothetical protein